MNGNTNILRAVLCYRKAGLKTGMYYLRSRPATDAIAFTVDPSMVKAAQQESKQIQPEDVKAPPTPVKSKVTGFKQAQEQIRAMALSAEGKDSLFVNIPEQVQTGAESAVPTLLLSDNFKEKLAAMTPDERKQYREEQEARMICSRENKEACLMCSG